MFDVFTVSASLYLNHEIMSIYRHSVEVNQGWAQRSNHAAELGRLAVAVNRPGNDVFASNDVETESAEMAFAARAFATRLEAVRVEFQANLQPADAEFLLADFDRLELTLNEMHENGKGIFAAFRRNDSLAAGRSMAEMDRKLVAANKVLTDVQYKIGQLQEEQFANQTRAAKRLQIFELIIGGLILLMVVGATFYGWKLSQQIHMAQEERERSRVELEQRVADRTAELSRANRSLQDAEVLRVQLLRQVITAHEDEQRRIARDLHDGIGQSMTSLLIGMRTVESAPDLATAVKRVGELRRIAGNALEEVRLLARGLRPTVLDDLGLAPALERLAEDSRRAHRLEIEVHTEALGARRLPEEVETALFRIVQEALTNTAKHARARHVDVRVKRTEESVQLEVSDDGRGFALPTGPASIHADKQFGLSGMRERAALLNGTCTIDARIGQGTRIAVEIPCEGGHGEDSRAAG